MPRPTHYYLVTKLTCMCPMAVMVDEGDEKELQRLRDQWPEPHYKIRRLKRGDELLTEAFQTIRDHFGTGCLCHLNPPIEDHSTYRFQIHMTKIVYVDVEVETGVSFHELEVSALEVAERKFGANYNLVETAGWAKLDETP